ncbi:MAG: hypothetical protein AB7O52_14255 [Planctomycetota bacterium]
MPIWTFAWGRTGSEWVSGALVILGLVGAFGCAGSGDDASRRDAADPPAIDAPRGESAVGTRTLMATEVLPNYRALLAGLCDPGPQGESDWTRLAGHAQRLEQHCGVWLEGSAPLRERAQESGDLDPTWELAALAFRQGSAATVRGLHAHDLAGSRSSFEALNDTCSSCHRECEAAYILPWE